MPPSCRPHGSTRLASLFVVALASATGASGAVAGSRSDASLVRISDDYSDALEARQLLPSFSPRGSRGWVDQLHRFQRRLHQIETRRLGPQARITYRMLEADLQRHLDDVEQGWVAREVNGSSSVLHTIAEAADPGAATTVSEWRYLIRRLANADRFVDSYAGMLERGLAAGQPQTREAVRSAIDSLGPLCSDRAAENPFLGIEDELARSLAGDPRLPALRAELRGIVRDRVLPAHRRLRRFLEKRYLPRAGRLGTDREAYLHFMRRELGADAPSPEHLARWGRREVARLNRELVATVRSVEPLRGGLDATLRRWNRRAHNRFDSDAEAIDAARVEIPKARELARKLVAIPRGEVELHPMPAYVAATYEALYSIIYGRAHLLLAGRDIPRFRLATLIAHEIYGGHFLADLHADRHAADKSVYRSRVRNTELEEGYALYMEEQRDEQGGFTPKERVGYLLDHLWRAARLVVDTGLHTGTMTPPEARRYFRKWTHSNRKTTAGEIERYINEPAQALAYYVGKHEIKKMRREAERILGPAFDIRRFHARLLSVGQVPTDELRGEVVRWAHRRLGQLRPVRRAASARPARAARIRPPRVRGR